MEFPKTYTLTISATDLPPAPLMGGLAGRTFGPAFTVTVLGDFSGIQVRRAGSELDLAAETGGQLHGKALIPAELPESGDLKLWGTDEPVKDQRGYRLAAGTILVDETGQLREVEKCVWQPATPSERLR